MSAFGESMPKSISEHGFAVLQSFFSNLEVDELIQMLNEGGAFSFGEKKETNLLKLIPRVRELAISERIKKLLTDDVGDSVFAINAIILDKTKKSNWGLDWHQDLKIPTRAVGDGLTDNVGAIVRFEPAPVEVLKKRITVRIHLDDCDKINGALVVIPGSHTLGILPFEKISQLINNDQALMCPMRAGDVMLMKPLLLHKSPYSTSSLNRRVLQIDYAATPLQGHQQWACAIC
jgi:hypothetical protein